RPRGPRPMTGTPAAEGVPSGHEAAAPGPAGAVRRWHAEYAWLGAAGSRHARHSWAVGDDPSWVASDVLIEASGERFGAVASGVPADQVPAGTIRLPGLTLPGLANAHSHAFHRALRGREPGMSDSFWGWREEMYQVAASLTPDT